MGCELRCDGCTTLVTAPDLEAFSDAYLAHVRTVHPEWPFPDLAIRNTAEATQRLTGPTERLESIGPVTVEAVTADRIEDWLAFFDHDAFAGNPVDAVCYCAGPHLPAGQAGRQPWRRNREFMIELFRSGAAHGYLAYVDDRPAGWVNASRRAACPQFRTGDPTDDRTIAITCVGIAPPCRGHGLADPLIGRVIADAPGRGAGWIEAYPFADQTGVDEDNWRGALSVLTRFGFEQAGAREDLQVLRRPALPT